MSEIETMVADHYTTGALTDRIRQALIELDIDPEAATPADLKPADEFHTGGMEATDALLAQLEITHATRVLDIGSGIGGSARLLADRYGCDVTGVDLTPEFVTCASALSDMVGLGDKVTFVEGSALDLPVPDSSADMAFLFHVGMNIEDKAALFQQVARALSTGGTFAVFDVMRGASSGPLAFPLPWSTEAHTSFVDPPAAYASAAEAVGFELVAQRDRTDFAKEFMARAFKAISEKGVPPLGIHLMMGPTAAKKLENYVTNLKAGLIAPTEMIFAKRVGHHG